LSVFGRARVLSISQATMRRLQVMKDEMPSGDAPVTKLLREWKLESVLPPRFNEQVWQRIETAGVPAVSPWALLRNWVARTLARPAMAISYVTVLLLAGLAIGFWRGQANSERAATELSARYVQLMSSYDSPHRP
jgi:hypothetical protein